MKLLFVLAHLFLFKLNNQTTGSVNLRVYNNSKYDVQKYTLIVNKHRFIYSDIPAHSYSKYQSLPYIYDSNESEYTFLIKPFAGRPYSITQHALSIDHTGDKKLENGSAVLILNIKVNHNKPQVETKLKQE